MKALRSASPGALEKNANVPATSPAQNEATLLVAEVTTSGQVVVEGSPDALHKATGTSDTRLATRMLNQASAGIGIATNPKDAAAELNAICAALKEMQPKDHLEGKLAVQINTSFDVAMQYLAKSTTGNQNDRDRNLNRYLKLMSSFQRGVDTLKRYRGKDPQRIQVQHFNMVNGGDAAITIGNTTEAN